MPLPAAAALALGDVGAKIAPQILGLISNFLGSNAAAQANPEDAAAIAKMEADNEAMRVALAAGGKLLGERKAVLSSGEAEVDALLPDKRRADREADEAWQRLLDREAAGG